MDGGATRQCHIGECAQSVVGVVRRSVWCDLLDEVPVIVVAVGVVAVDGEAVVEGIVGGDVFAVDGSRGSVAVGVVGVGLDDMASLFDPDQASSGIVGIAVRDPFAPFSGVVSVAI